MRHHFNKNGIVTCGVIGFYHFIKSVEFFNHFFVIFCAFQNNANKATHIVTQLTLINNRFCPFNQTRLTVWTVIAVVGCLPACKSVVSLIMIFRAKPVAPQVYQEISKHAGELVMSYEMYMTFYEKSASIDAFAICGNTVVGFSSDPKIDAAFMEQEAQKILRGNGFKANVKIFTRLPQFLERLDSMNEHRESLEEGIKFRPDEKYPELSRNELIKHTILAICV